MDKKLDVYEEVTLYHFSDGSHVARLYTHVKSCDLRIHVEVDYSHGKREMARLMLRLNQMPEVHRRDSGFVSYELRGFLN